MAKAFERNRIWSKGIGLYLDMDIGMFDVVWHPRVGDCQLGGLALWRLGSLPATSSNDMKGRVGYIGHSILRASN